MLTKNELEATLSRVRTWLRWAADDATANCARRDAPALLAHIDELTAERDKLRAALQSVVDDIHEYERINNLAPNPGRSECWDSVARAMSLLKGRPDADD